MAGFPDQRRRRTGFRLLALAGLGVLPFLSSWWGDGFLHEAVEWVGLLAIIAGTGGRAWCTLYIGGRKFSELIVAGPYSVSRNPLYLFTVLAVTGTGWQSGSVLVGLAAGLAAFLGLDRTIRREEVALAGQFGDAYDRYRADVPRWGPSVRSFRDEAMLSVPPRLLYRTVRDGLAYLAILPLFELIDWLQEIGWIVPLLHLP